MNPSPSQRFNAIAVNHAVSEIHASSPTRARLHTLLPHVESVCDFADLPKAMAKLARLAKPGGHVAIIDMEGAALSLPLTD